MMKLFNNCPREIPHPGSSAVLIDLSVFICYITKMIAIETAIISNKDMQFCMMAIQMELHLQIVNSRAKCNT